MEQPLSKKSGMESRRASRTPLVAKVRMKISKKMRGKVALVEELMNGETIDISTLGVGVYGPVYLPKGVWINAKISRQAFGSNEKGEMPLVGTVKNTRMAQDRPGYRIGIEFERISKKNLRIIEGYVKKSLKS